MVREPNLERGHRTFGRILDDLDARPEPGPWIDAARTLSERLIISEDTFYYFAEKFTECVIFAASQADAELVRIATAMEEIERAHGLRDDDYWHINEAPEEWQSLNKDWDRRADEIANDCLRDAGHADIAALREAKPDDYGGRTSKGGTDLWGEDEEEDCDGIS
jgi:hypothetical protein